jgi:hypothetical protein
MKIDRVAKDHFMFLDRRQQQGPIVDFVVDNDLVFRLLQLD